MPFAFKVEDLKSAGPKSYGKNHSWMFEPQQGQSLEEAWKQHGIIEAMSEAPKNIVETFTKQNLLVKSVHAAFYGHHPLILSPDVIWLTIAQGLANHLVISCLEHYMESFQQKLGVKEFEHHKNKFKQKGQHFAWADRPPSGTERGIKLELFPPALSSAPFVYKDTVTNKKHSMAFMGGLTTLVQHPSGAIEAKIGWAVIDSGKWEPIKFYKETLV